MGAVLAVLRRHMGAPPVARAATGLLRQLANNDDNKGAIVEGGGMELLCVAAATHTADGGILEQVRPQYGALHPPRYRLPCTIITTRNDDNTLCRSIRPAS